jgi:hypothetical protein
MLSPLEADALTHGVKSVQRGLQRHLAGGCEGEKPLRAAAALSGRLTELAVDETLVLKPI